MKFYINDNNSVFNGARTNWSNLQSKYPPLNILDNEKEYRVEVELPGFTIEDINLKLEKHVLRISSKESKKEELAHRYIVRERVKKKFERSLSLGTDVEEDELKANLKNGLLVVSLPKKAEEQPKQIDVAIN